MRQLRWWVVCAVLVGCGRSASSAPALQIQTVNDITITLEYKRMPVMMEAQTWTVRLSDSQGVPIDGADVYLDLVMPGMAMGQQKPLATAQGSGRYLATGFYSMDSQWQVVVHAEVAGVDTQATFTIDVQSQ